MNKLVITLILFVFFSGTAIAQLTNASKKLIHTQTALVLERGQLDVSADMNFFTKAGEFIGNTKPQDFSSTNLWLVAGNMNFTYGIMEHFDASLGIRLYQDTHRDNEFNFPDDMFLTLRAGSFRFGDNHFQGALFTSFRFPTGEVHNYPFTEYSSGSFEYGFLGAISFYLDPYLPRRSFNYHFNMGWWNHNEKGNTLYEFESNYGAYKAGDKLEATRSSKEFRMATAAVFPTALFDFRLELSGILFITEPNSFVYSAEEWAFITPSLRFKPNRWSSFDIGADLRISPSDRQRTTADIPDISSRLDLPKNYPAWKIYLAANISMNVLKKQMGIGKDYERLEAQEKIELFESILDERRKAKTAQEEIENLRKIRREAEKEIEDLKKVLED